MGIYETKQRKYFEKAFLAHTLSLNESHEALILAVFNAGFDPAFPDEYDAIAIMLSTRRMRDFSEVWRDEINQFCREFIPSFVPASSDYCQAAFSMVASGVRFLFDRHSFLALARKQHKYNKVV